MPTLHLYSLREKNNVVLRTVFQQAYCCRGYSPFIIICKKPCNLASATESQIFHTWDPWGFKVSCCYGNVSNKCILNAPLMSHKCLLNSLCSELAFPFKEFHCSFLGIFHSHKSNSKEQKDNVSNANRHKSNLTKFLDLQTQAQE